MGNCVEVSQEQHVLPVSLEASPASPATAESFAPRFESWSRSDV